jgi:CDP-glycerol glycerophosphotransferase (TagB/SpsB family)
MKSMIEKINEVLKNENYPVELFKINNQVIYNLQNSRSSNKILKKLFKIEKHLFEKKA